MTADSNDQAPTREEKQHPLAHKLDAVADLILELASQFTAEVDALPDAHPAHQVARKMRLIARDAQRDPDSLLPNLPLFRTL